ncbi:hypothetical protein GUJ93_ZPchr0005g15332 [Zizania palustris]|uniref:Uncharacterized protein n=1 Tax=Zizania palustris TaxID=103762 RepID=A0A8J5VFY5_ZIZPA|nr:hypothetical protein GUJ93_ZPchr0005g15332 [Zizania palustris]
MRMASGSPPVNSRACCSGVHQAALECFDVVLNGGTEGNTWASQPPPRRQGPASRRRPSPRRLPPQARRSALRARSRAFALEELRAEAAAFGLRGFASAVQRFFGSSFLARFGCSHFAVNQ